MSPTHLHSKPQPKHARLAAAGKIISILVVLILIIGACTAPPASPGTTEPIAVDEVLSMEEMPPSHTPFQPVPPTSTPSPTPEPDLSIWISPAVPAELESNLNFPEAIPGAESAEDAALWISLDQDPLAGNPEEMVEVSTTPWVFALVAPFPTIPDGVALQDIRSAWKGEGSGLFGGLPLLMDQRTGSTLTAMWGPSGPDGVHFLPPEDILDYAWNHRPSWAIVPFEALEPRWKVLHIDGVSPLAKEFDPGAYPLTITYHMWSRPGSLDALHARLESAGISSILPPANRDPNRLSVVMVTGVTALVRATAWMMVTRGIEFPARDVGDLLREADITHISNEVAFAPDCPAP
ncbi:MAG: hypothetical protein EHM70_23665, partial [Chloroflexota bacterium]